MLLIGGDPRLCRNDFDGQDIVLEVFHVIVDIQRHGAVCPFLLCAACGEEGFFIFCEGGFPFRFVLGYELLNLRVYLGGQFPVGLALDDGNIDIQLYVILGPRKGAEGQHLCQLSDNGNFSHILGEGGTGVQPDCACHQYSGGCRHAALPDGAAGRCFGCVFFGFMFHQDFLFIF